MFDFSFFDNCFLLSSTLFGVKYRNIRFEAKSLCQKNIPGPPTTLSIEPIMAFVACEGLLKDERKKKRKVGF
jgi:hypothetical protein